MEGKRIVVRKSELVYFLAIIIYLIAWVIWNSEFSEAYNFMLWRYVNYIVMPILLVKMYLDRKYYGNNLVVLLVVLLALIASYTAGGYTIFIIFLFVLSARNTNYKRCLKVYCVTLCVCVLTVLFFYVIGILPDVVSRTIRGDRHGLGFTYTTFLPNYFFHILLIVLILLGEKLKYWQLAGILVLNYIIYYYTLTKASYYETVLLVLLVIIIKIFRLTFQKKIFEWIALLSYPIMAITAIYTSYIYPGKTGLLVLLNQLLTNRLYLGHKAIERYGLHLLGQNVIWNVGRGFDYRYEYFYVDSSFLNIILSYGGIVLLVIIAAYIWLFYKAYKYKMTYLYIALFMLAVHSTWDPQLIDFKMNGMVILISGFFWGEKEEYNAKAFGTLK